MKPQKMLAGLLFVVFFLFVFQEISFFVRTYAKEIVVCNNAGPWSIAIDSMFFPLILGIAFGFFVFLWQKKQSKSPDWWLLIVTAGLSNIGERLFFGCVVDYIHWPFGLVGNMADIALTVSVVFLIWKEIRKGKRAF